jgi:hypothetical protein
VARAPFYIKQAPRLARTYLPVFGGIISHVNSIPTGTQAGGGGNRTVPQ